ncbi:MAG: GNVR domain-containing protein [Pseudomonadota bacterium]
MGDEFTLEDVLIVLQRRILFFLIPFIVLAPLGVLFVMLLPPKYTAEGKILVESQQIPEDWAPSTIIASALERIETIRQRVMTRNRLLEISDKYDLFPRELGLSETERVELMRERLVVNPITTQVNRRGRRQQDGAIAFSVSYTDRSSENAYAVANEFMSLFLKEDVNARTAAASDTTEFFKSEAERLRNAVAELETQIAAFKVQNNNALPEHLNLHLDMLERANREMNTDQSTILSLEEELRFLETQLSSVMSGAGGEEGPAQELARLRSELTRLRATFTDANPSVRAIRDEIAAIERQMAPSAAIKKRTEELEEARSALAEAERAEEPNAEEIEKMRDAMADANRALSDQFAKEARSRPGNLMSQTFQSRISTTKSRIEMLRSQQNDTRGRVTDLQNRIAQTPEVERRLASLTRDYENIRAEYQEVLAKQQAAQLAENLEDNQKAEKFRVLEAAVQPEKPSSPERAKLSVLAIFAALGAGAAAALAAELIFSTIRGRNHLTNLIEDHPIAVIPYIRRENEKRMPIPFARKKKAAPAIAASAAIAVGAAVAPDDPIGEEPVSDPSTRNTI